MTAVQNNGKLNLWNNSDCSLDPNSDRGGGGEARGVVNQNEVRLKYTGPLNFH